MARRFEVDARFTQARKTGILNRNHTDISHINFMAADIETDSLTGALLGAGFDKQKNAAFIWEGVTLCLSREAVRDTLKSVAQLARGGSRISLDYLNFEPNFEPDKASGIIRKDEDRPVRNG